MLRKNRKIELIRKVPLFAGCSKKELERISMIADEIDFRSGKTLIKEGAPGREFFVLADGTAEISRKGKRIDTAGPGEFFGEMALLTDQPRNATVTTTSDGRRARHHSGELPQPRREQPADRAQGDAGGRRPPAAGRDLAAQNSSRLRRSWRSIASRISRSSSSSYGIPDASKSFA